MAEKTKLRDFLDEVGVEFLSGLFVLKISVLLNGAEKIGIDDVSLDDALDACDSHDDRRIAVIRLILQHLEPLNWSTSLAWQLACRRRSEEICAMRDSVSRLVGEYQNDVSYSDENEKEESHNDWIYEEMERKEQESYWAEREHNETMELMTEFVNYINEDVKGVGYVEEPGSIQ